MNIDWKTFIAECYATRKASEPDVVPQFYPGADEACLAAAEADLGFPLPTELRELLSQSDGVKEQLLLDDGPIEISWLVWSTEELIASNLSLRGEAGVSAAHRLTQGIFFVNAGMGGSQLGLDGRPSDRPSCPVFVWHPIEDRTEVLAHSLADFLTRWIQGGITL